MIFEVTDNGSVILRHFSNRAEDTGKDKKAGKRSIVNVHLSGENQNDHHFAKHTGCSGDVSLKYQSHKYYQNENGNKLEFTLADDRMLVVVHYQFYNGISAVRSWCELENISAQPIGLEYVSSFAYTGFDDGALPAEEKIRVFIPHNAWLAEMNWKEYSLSQLGIENIGSSSNGKRIAISNTGTWSSKEHLPMGAVSNTETAGTYLWQIESNGSWHWEIASTASMLYFKLSGPTENENHWHKELLPSQRFESVTSCVCVADCFDSALEAMTAYRRVIYTPNAPSIKVPVIFNDYMNCLGANPTEEKELAIIDLAAETGAEYYCMDAGWYADGTWWETVGEWQPCDWRFPNGIKKVFDYVREKGMVPGIWLEPEVMGINCPLAKTWPDERFFIRHGRRVIDHGRYQLDFRNPDVRDFLTDVVDRLVTEYGIGYIKTDYNIEGGAGTEYNSDSVGDGLLEHNRAYFDWLCSICAKYPSLIIESCASGGMRMDYKMLSLLQIQSVSDQTDYRITAHIAAAASTAVLPEQSAVWSYPLSEADKNAVSMNMVNSLLQRIHLSGKIFDWNHEQMSLVKEAIAYYKTYRHDMPLAIPFYPLGIPEFSDKLFCSAYKYPSCLRLGVWRTDSGAESICIPLDTEYKNARIAYPSECAAKVKRTPDGIQVTLPEQFSAVIIEVY